MRIKKKFCKTQLQKTCCLVFNSNNLLFFMKASVKGRTQNMPLLFGKLKTAGKLDPHYYRLNGVGIGSKFNKTE